MFFKHDHVFFAFLLDFLWLMHFFHDSLMIFKMFMIFSGFCAFIMLLMSFLFFHDISDVVVVCLLFGA